MQAMSRLIRRDLAFYAAIAIYGAVALAASLWLGDVKWFTPAVYFRGRIIGFLALLLGICAVRAAQKGGFANAFAADFKHWPRALAGIFLFAGMILFLGTFTSMKVMMPQFMPFSYDPLFAEIDKTMLGADAWTYLRWMTPFDRVIEVLYGPLWFAILIGGLFLVCVTEWQRRRQYVWAFLACWVVLGNVLALAFMAAGPLFYQGITGSARFAELGQSIFAPEHRSQVTSLEARYLWDAYVNHETGFGFGISAFPSVHVSMATLFMLAAFGVNRRLGYAMTAYLVFVVAASIHLGWHYAIDGYVSILATTVIWKVAGLTSAKTASASGQLQRA